MASMVCFGMGCYLVLDLLLLGLHVEGKWKNVVGNVNVAFIINYFIISNAHIK